MHTTWVERSIVSILADLFFKLSFLNNFWLLIHVIIILSWALLLILKYLYLNCSLLNIKILVISVCFFKFVSFSLFINLKLSAFRTVSDPYLNGFLCLLEFGIFNIFFLYKYLIYFTFSIADYQHTGFRNGVPATPAPLLRHLLSRNRRRTQLGPGKLNPFIYWNNIWTLRKQTFCDFKYLGSTQCLIRLTSFKSHNLK